MSFACPVLPPVPYAVYLGVTTDTTSPASYSFADVDLGLPSNDRVIVVVAGNRDSGAAGDVFATCTIAGITATNVVSQTNSALGIAIKSAPVPTGATGTITLAVADTVDHAWIAVYAVYGLASTVAVDTDTGSDADSFTALTVLSGGVVIAGGVAIAAASFAPTSLTENYDADVETARYTAASTSGVVGATTYAAALTGSGTRAIVAASFR